MGFFSKLFGGGEAPAPAPQEAAKSMPDTGAEEEQFFGATMEKSLEDKAALDKWNEEQDTAREAKAALERDMKAAAEVRTQAVAAEGVLVDENEGEVIVGEDPDEEAVNG